MFDILAKTTLVFHFLFIIFVIFGSFFILIKFKFILFHLPSLLWGVYIEFSHSVCPLTHLENWFLKKAGTSFYTGGFLENYIYNLVYPVGINAEIQIIFGIILILFNLLIYCSIFYIRFLRLMN